MGWSRCSRVTSGSGSAGSSTPFARIDNLFDKRYVGSVIVNEGNARYFEPAPGRNWTVGMGGAYRF
jgi:hypothetical protein